MSEDSLTPRMLPIIAALTVSAAASAQEMQRSAPTQLSLMVASDPAGELCRRIDPQNTLFAQVGLHRTFHDDFDEHPLTKGKWVPHYAGGAAWPEARYWGGTGSDFKRKTAWNGEQQIYVDPRYAGRGTTPLGLDPFTVNDGVL